jgi:hypothetical protein
VSFFAGVSPEGSETLRHFSIGQDSVAALIDATVKESVAASTSVTGAGHVRASR